MKNLHKLSGILLITTIILTGFACQDGEESSAQSNSEENYEAQLPLIYQMAFIDRYATKLYLAGVEENWALADIYAHELEEVSDMIIGGNYVDEGINRSELLETILLPQIEQMEVAIDSKDAELFQKNYQTMINSCNQCHSISQYGLIKITIPENNPYNQDFSAN
ncbi:MAG: hypothetical protein WD016_04320 [Balneolaceae bacterium]